jgi:uncharacterized protein (UPF0335 family)
VSGGSQQARILRRALRGGMEIEAAAEAAGMTLAEARLQQRDEERNPPAEEAFDLIGHNSPPKGQTMTATADDRLRLLIERIERLEEERKGIGEDIKDVFAEAKSTGYDPKIIRKVLKLRKMRPEDRAEMDAVLASYLNAVDLQLDLPLAVAA